MIKVSKKKIPLLFLLIIFSILIIYLLIPKNIGNDNPIAGYKFKCLGYEFKKESDFFRDTTNLEVYNYYCIGIPYDSIDSKHGETCFKIGTACRRGE